MAFINIARPNDRQLVLTTTDGAEAGAIDDLIAMFTAAAAITDSPTLTRAAITAATHALTTLRTVATELTVSPASPTSEGDLALTGKPASVVAFMPLLDVLASIQSEHTDTEE